MKRLFILLLTTLLMSCASSKENGKNKENVLSEKQQNSYLSHAKPPQYYGFTAYPVQDGIAIQGQTRLHHNHIASAPFKKGTIPVIGMRGRSPRMKMDVLLDTSSPDSWMEFTTSQDFGAVFLGMDELKIPYRGGYNTGDAPGYAAVVTQLRIKQLFMEDIPLYVRMAKNSLGPLARGIQVPQVDAVLGYDVLKTFEYVQFDFNSKIVKFSSTHPYVPHQNLLMASAKIVDLPNYGLAVEGAIFGEPTPIILDVAGDYHFARGDVKVSSTKQVSIGDVVFRNVPTLLLPINHSPPRVGRKLLEQYIITICNHEGIVYFERLPE